MRRLPILAVIFISTLARLPVQAETAKEVAEKIAAAGGYEDFGQVESIGFTFRLDNKGKEVTRIWKWWPREDKVSLTGEDGKVTEYVRSASDRPEKTDRQFVNDQYWLLFPFHLIWDQDAALETFEPTAELQAATEAEVSGLRVSYPAEGGYTPGDIYELFYNEQNQIVRWIFRKGGKPAEGTGMTWEDYQKAGPLTLSMNHRREGEDFRLWFTDVTVE